MKVRKEGLELQVGRFNLLLKAHRLLVLENLTFNEKLSTLNRLLNSIRILQFHTKASVAGLG